MGFYCAFSLTVVKFIVWIFKLPANTKEAASSWIYSLWAGDCYAGYFCVCIFEEDSEWMKISIFTFFVDEVEEYFCGFFMSRRKWNWIYGYLWIKGWTFVVILGGLFDFLWGFCERFNEWLDFWKNFWDFLWKLYEIQKSSSHSEVTIPNFYTIYW